MNEGRKEARKEGRKEGRIGAMLRKYVGSMEPWRIQAGLSPGETRIF
jgi:hypothetical protein